MANIYNLSDTWNDAGTPFNGISIDVTNTASHADSRLQRWKVNGVEKASLTTDGMLNLPSGNSAAVRVEMPVGVNAFQIFAHPDGFMAFGYNGAGAFGVSTVNEPHNPALIINHGRGSGQLVFGSGFNSVAGWTAGLKRVGDAVIGITDGTTGDGSLEVSYVRTKPLIVSALPAAATAGEGAHAFVTNALTPVYGSTVVGGGAVKTPVHSDGTNWIVG